MIRMVLALAVCVLTAGCVTTDISDTRPGMFKGNFKALSKAYEEVDNMLKAEPDRKPTRDFIERSTGLNFSAANVERFPGPAAFQRIFGGTIYQGALSDVKNTEALLKEMRHFKAYFITYRYITTETDRYYFSTKDTYKKGDDLLILFIFKDDQLFYNEYKYVRVDTHESTHAFAQGLIDILKEYLGPASAMYDLAEKLKDQFDTKKE